MVRIQRDIAAVDRNEFSIDVWLHLCDLRCPVSCNGRTGHNLPRETTTVFQPYQRGALLRVIVLSYPIL